MRVNGSLLGKYVDKKVSIIGTVQSVHPSSTAFNITSDNHNITIELSKAFSGDVAGLVEIHGIARGPATVACDYFIVFPYDLARTYDAETDNEAITLGFRLANPWRLFQSGGGSSIINMQVNENVYLSYTYLDRQPADQGGSPKTYIEAFSKLFQTNLQ